MKKRRPISLGVYPWIADTVFQLATNSTPPVMVQFREEILAEKTRAEQREAATHWPDRVALEEGQMEDGTWTPEVPETEAEEQEIYLDVTRKLLHLHDLGVRRDADVVRLAVDYLGTVQDEDGSFPLSIHHTALTLYVLAMFGLGKSPVAKRTIRFLDRMRRRDSGWLDPSLEPALHEDPDAPSCAWTTLHVTLAMTEIPDLRRSMDVRRAAVFLLDRMFKRNHQSFFGHPDHWRELDYDYETTACFKWAVPKMLLILGRLGCGPETKEVSDLLDFLRKTLRPSGRWGANQEGSDALTLRILRALMAVQEAGA
ncbi:MAG: prenyltransferase/squalene oxidase repeat-containing protein [Planctomycetota bacterium]